MSRSNNEWKFYKRWKIVGTLRTATSLHIGTGDTYLDDRLIKTKKEVGDVDRAVQINAIFRDRYEKFGAPLIPGSALKGAMRAWLDKRIEDDDIKNNRILLEQIFGRHASEDDQGRGGRAEFLDASFKRGIEKKDEILLPYWNAEKQTYIETSTVIDRITGTVVEGKLAHFEMVPPGVEFRLEISGAMTEQQTALLLAALDGFNHATHPVSLGAETSNGKGRMTWDHDYTLECLDADGVVEWINKHEYEMAFDAMRKLEKPERDRIFQGGKKLIQAKSKHLCLDLTLQFDGPFLVNDPPAEIVKEEPHQRPLRDIEGNPVLPVKSFRGALRSQAERIIRTLGGQCCDTLDPCASIYDEIKLDDRCLACQVFGLAGWQTTVHVHEFRFLKSDREKVVQDFVAIDRFHGGAKDGAKFSSEYSLRPCFKTILEIDERLPEWGKGLLALTLRDLKEGDIPFGFGAAKGYGHLESVTVDNLESLFANNSVNAFHETCRQQTKPYPCVPRGIPNPQDNPKRLERISSKSGDFHNPYHFVPNLPPDTQSWLKLEEFGENMHDSHALYRNRDDHGNEILHGRIRCELTTTTPIFIGGERRGGTPEKIDHYLLNEEIAIPATSLRGIISSLAESASNSAMRVLSMDPTKGALLSFRKSVDARTEQQKPLSAIGMVTERDAKLFIIPLALPTLEKAPNGTGEIPNSYRKMFIDGVARLKVYLQNSCKPDYPYDTWAPQNPKIYYLPLDNLTIENGSVTLNNGTLKIRKHFVLGQLPVGTDELSTKNMSGKTPGILRIFGKQDREGDQLPPTKKHELFIPIPDEFARNPEKYIATATAFEIEASAIEQFHQLADERTRPQTKKDPSPAEYEWLPYHLKGTNRNREDSEEGETHFCRLKSGDIVYFRPNHNGDMVAEVSISSVWRGKVPAPTYEFFHPEHRPFNEKRKAISPAELLFGFVQDDKTQAADTETKALSFAGKVRVSSGTLTKGQTDLQLDPVTLKILSSPKPPSPALYFKRSRNDQKYIAKHELNTKPNSNLGRVLAQGRKYYLHPLMSEQDPQAVQKLSRTGKPRDNHAQYPWESAKSDEFPNQKVSVRPIRKDVKFMFSVDFENLSRWELGLLLYALRPSDKFRHKIGMGKPIGLGSVCINIEELNVIDRYRYYSEGSFDQTKLSRRDSVKDWSAMRDQFAKTIEPDIRRAIELLGDPSQIRKPVHYPQAAGKPIEEKTYQWFVANDIGSGKGRQKIAPAKDSLESLNSSTEILPSLKQHPWSDN